MIEPRGIRNNNPGNLRHGDRWQGMATEQTDADFVVFTTPVYGIRALAKVLLTYQRIHGISTVEGIISRFAPPGENDTKAYTKAVAAACQVGAREVISVEEYLPDLIPAIIRHENGRQPYDQRTIQEGIDLALNPGARP